MGGLVSGEGVALELTHAGPGSRSVAAALDLLAEFAALIAILTVTAATVNGDDAIAAALTILELVLILAGYPIIFEWLTRGRTLGKMAMGLRVVRDDGGPIGFRQALVRGLVGLFLEKPGLLLGGLGTAIGLITMTASESSKRVGDMMAGTFVLNQRAGAAATLQPIAWWVPPALYGWAQSLDLSGVDDALALQVRQFVVRAREMSPSAQYELGEQFRYRVLAATAPPPPPGVPTPTLLTTVLAERSRRAYSPPTYPPGPIAGPGPVTHQPGGAYAPPG